MGAVDVTTVPAFRVRRIENAYDGRPDKLVRHEMTLVIRDGHV
jgi:hypothetical protein